MSRDNSNNVSKGYPSTTCLTDRLTNPTVEKVSIDCAADTVNLLLSEVRHGADGAGLQHAATSSAAAASLAAAAASLTDAATSSLHVSQQYV